MRNLCFLADGKQQIPRLMKPGFGMTNLMTRLEAVARINAKADDRGYL